MNTIKNQCVICYKAISAEVGIVGNFMVFKNKNSDCLQNCSSVEIQLPVIFLIRQLLKIPEDMCLKFLQDIGNPFSWIFWCNSCSKVIGEAGNLFKEIQILEKKLNLLRMDIKNTIVESSDPLLDDYSCNNSSSAKKINPTEEIRSFVITEHKSHSHQVEVKTEPEENVSFAEGYFSDTQDGKLSGEESPNTRTKHQGKSIDNKILRKTPSRVPVQKKSRVAKNKNESNKIEESDGSNEWLPDKDNISDVELDLLSSNKGNKKKSSRVVRRGEFKCDVCLRPFNYLDSVKRHFQKNHGELPLKCSSCQYPVLNEQELEEHNKMHHSSNVNKFFCDICNKGFSRGTNLNFHKRYEHEKHKFGQGFKTYNCKECETVLTSLRAYKSHCKKLHRKEIEISSLDCGICQKKFTKLKYLKEHYRSKHIEEFEKTFPKAKSPNIFQCSSCDYKTFAKHRMIEHKKVHSNLRPFICGICSEGFTTKRYLEHHCRSKHYQELSVNPFKCEECGKTFGSPNYLQTHIRTLHMNQFNFYCSQCGKGCDRQSTLDLHMKRHQGIKSELCAECGITFISNSALTGHIRRCHTQYRPFKCKQCPKSFKTGSAYRRHVDGVHSQGNNPFKCEICPKTFPVRNYLYIHMRSHKKRGEVPNKEQATPVPVLEDTT